MITRPRFTLTNCKRRPYRPAFSCNQQIRSSWIPGKLGPQRGKSTIYFTHSERPYRSNCRVRFVKLGHNSQTNSWNTKHLSENPFNIYLNRFNSGKGKSVKYFDISSRLCVYPLTISDICIVKWIILTFLCSLHRYR